MRLIPIYPSSFYLVNLFLEWLSMVLLTRNVQCIAQNNFFMEIYIDLIKINYRRLLDYLNMSKPKFFLLL
jgi:hypothetical protein